MQTHFLSLDKILDMPRWQTLQDSLAVSTKLAIITVDYKGTPITTHSERRPFCKMIRESQALGEYCRKCDSRAGLEAVRINKPYIYLCHCNIVDIAIPITVDNKYIGAIMAGEVKLSEGIYNLEQILVSGKKDFMALPNYQLLYDAIPSISYREIEIAAQMIFDLCQYIVGEALNRNLIQEIYEQFSLDSNVAQNRLLDGYSLDALQKMREKLGNESTNAYIEKSGKSLSTCANPVLQPAFDYIYQNKRENVTQKKAASLCHISTSHFSRLFAKEIGEHFSSFLSRQKVGWSKQLLEQTDLSITQISEDLGFGEPGYFIKIFKKYEAVTPAIYRKYYKESQTDRLSLNYVI